MEWHYEQKLKGRWQTGSIYNTLIKHWYSWHINNKPVNIK